MIGLEDINWIYYIKQRFHVAVRLFSNRSQKTPKRGKNISDTLGYRLVGHLFVLTTFWRHLWSITEQTHGNMESICYTGGAAYHTAQTWF